MQFSKLIAVSNLTVKMVSDVILFVSQVHCTQLSTLLLLPIKQNSILPKSSSLSPISWDLHPEQILETKSKNVHSAGPAFRIQFSLMIFENFKKYGLEIKLFDRTRMQIGYSCISYAACHTITCNKLFHKLFALKTDPTFSHVVHFSLSRTLFFI